MRLIGVHATSFGPFVEPMSLPLDRQGLVFVVGVNAADPGFDSNGAGKSSILDAIMWGLTGETSTRRESTSSDSGLKSDEVVNDDVGKDCVVLVDFEGVDGRVYRARRWRKAKPAWASTRGNGVDLITFDGGVEGVIADLDRDNVQREITARLGFTHALLSETVIRGQEDGSSFALATPTGRFDLLTQIEGLEDLDQWKAVFAARSRQLHTELAQLTGFISGTQAAIDILRSEDAKAATALSTWENERSARVTRLYARRESVVGQVEALDARLATRNAVRNAHAEWIRQRDLLVYPKEAPELQQWRDRVAALSHGYSVAFGQKSAAEKRLSTVQRLGVGSCSTCGQQVTAGHIEQHKKELTDEIATHTATMQTYAADKAAAEKIVSDAEKSLRAAHTEVDVQKRALQEKVGAEEQILRALDLEEKNRARMIQEIGVIDNEIVQAQQQVNPLAGAADVRLASIKEQEGKLAALKQEEQVKTSEAGLQDWWVRAIPSMKSWIFDGVVAEITKETNRWLSITTGGVWFVDVKATSTTKGGEVRDKVSLLCSRWMPDGGIKTREFRQLSGGQKQRIAAALTLAIAQRLAQRSAAKCSFLALDEPDRQLDRAGRVGLLNALDILRREKETVVIVTHDADMRAKPDVVWRVTRTSSGSKVEVERGSERGQAATEAVRGVAPVESVVESRRGDDAPDDGGRPASPNPRKARRRPGHPAPGKSGET